MNYFANAADTLGIIFFKFPDERTMIEIEENMNKYVQIVLRGDNE